MFVLRLLWWVLGSLSMVFAQQGFSINVTEFRGLLYEKRGDVSLTGLFGRPFGNECSSEFEGGLEEIISAIWTIEALNTYEYLPGITIGLTVFDVCETLKGETTFNKMVEGLSRFNKEAVNIGILATPEIYEKLTGSESIPHSDIVRMKHIMSSDILTEVTLQLLLNLQWMNVTTIIFDSENGMKSFTEKGMMEGIFIQNSVLINCSNSCSELGNFTEKFKISSVTVVIASFDNIVHLFKNFHNKNTRLILTPTDFIFNFKLLDLPRNTIICLPSMQDKRLLAGVLDNIQRRKDFFSRKPPIKGPLFLGTATTIITFLKPLKTALEEKCRNESLAEQPCVPVADFIAEIKGNKGRLLSHKTIEISSDDVEEALKVLKVEPSSNDEMFLYIASVINANVSEDFAIFQIFNPKLKLFQPAPIMINDDLLRIAEAEKDLFDQIDSDTMTRRRSPSVSPLQELSGTSVGLQGLQAPSEGSPLDRGCDHQDVRCPNPEKNLTAILTKTNNTKTGVPEVSWRFLTWVSVNTSLGLVGVMCTLSIILFVCIKICKNDFLEGSPYFTLLLMISVVFTYISSFPFHIEFPEEGFMCGYQKCIPPVVFAVLFSLLLSRSLMIAFTETGGGVSGNINGYLQSILCVFMIGVQASITLQNWILAKDIQDLSCADVYDKYNVIFTLVYDVLLVILLACISPFIVRSKRNCKEGLLFSISTFFIAIVWSAWISFYVLLPKEYKDAAVAVGLNSTASVLLLCIFIPQMYFMALPFPQDQTICSFSALDGNGLAGGSHPNFKSNHALNECAFGSYKNCEMGCVNPSFAVSRPNGSNALGGTDNFVGEHICDMTPEVSQPN